jgi:hypothetical protein
MGVCWTDDRDPFGSPAPAPGRAAGPAPVPGSAAGAGPGPAQYSDPPARVTGAHQHRRRRGSAAPARPQAAAARITTLLGPRRRPAPRRAYRRYWV